MAITAAGISAAGNLLGGIGALGGLFGGSSGGSQTSETISQLQPFKQIRWRVQDAKAAGIHPLYALGVTPSPSPISVIEGQPDIGRLMATAGDQFARAADKLKGPSTLEQAQIRAVNSSANRDDAQAAATVSSMRIAEQEALRGPEIPNLYIPVKNNRTGETVYLPNPDLGIEMPETLGAVYWAGGKLMDSRTNKPVPLPPGQTDYRNFNFRGGPQR